MLRPLGFCNFEKLFPWWGKILRVLHHHFPPHVGAVSIHWKGKCNGGGKQLLRNLRSIHCCVDYDRSIISRAGVSIRNISTQAQKTTNDCPLKSQSGNHGLVCKKKKGSLFCRLFNITTPSQREHRRLWCAEHCVLNIQMFKLELDLQRILTSALALR